MGARVSHPMQRAVTFVSYTVVGMSQRPTCVLCHVVKRSGAPVLYDAMELCDRVQLLNTFSHQTGRGRLASYSQQLHAYPSITALTLTLFPPLHKSAECTRLLLHRQEDYCIQLASCLIYAKPLGHPFRAFIEYICGCVLFQDVTIREIRGR